MSSTVSISSFSSASQAFLSETTLLTDFEKKLTKQKKSKKHLNIFFVPTSQGGTGFTYLCSMPDTQNVTFTNFVLKWELRPIAYNEALCTKIMKIYGFTVPQIYMI